MKPNVDALTHLEIPPALPMIFQINERTIPVTFFRHFHLLLSGSFWVSFTNPFVVNLIHLSTIYPAAVAAAPSTPNRIFLLWLETS